MTARFDKTLMHAEFFGGHACACHMPASLSAVLSGQAWAADYVRVTGIRDRGSGG